MSDPLRTGFNRFRFGFADIGETMFCPDNGKNYIFIGNFNRKKAAKEAAYSSGGFCNGYLYGKLKRGWSVWKTAAAELTTS